MDTPAPQPATPTIDMDALRRQSAQVARALSRELPNAPIAADTPWTRFQHDVEAAHVESGGFWTDTYASPDGTIIYRKHIGGRTICRMSGNTGDGTGGIRGVDEAGDVRCPSGVQWRR